MTAADILKKHTCEIVEDLLPLYAEANIKPPASIATNSMNTQTAAFVAEHLKDCAGCRSLLEMIQEDFPEPCPDLTDIPAIPFRRKYHIRLALGTICAITASVGILIILGGMI